jgi:5-methylcytosine-specific restriction endonuclease McrA
MNILELTKPERRKGFETFLSQSGADLIAPTSQWELLRFTTARGVGIVYVNAKGRITLTGEAEPAFDAYRKQQGWDAGHKTPRKNNRPNGVMRRLLERDGPACFICLKDTTPDDRTIDHMIPLAHGGPNNVHNYALAHKRCNADAGNKTLMEKIRARETLICAEAA